MMPAVEEFQKLLEVMEKLMGPDGCPWDREQTLSSIRHSILEEACEAIEAIHENDPQNLLEELGDLLYNVLFFCRLAEKENFFVLQQVIFLIREKLISRHPHVFGAVVLSDADAVITQWEQIKSTEQGKLSRKSVLDGIPHSLPGLSRAYKMIGKMQKKHYEMNSSHPVHFETEEELGAVLWELILDAKQKGLHPELALRKIMTQKEKEFRSWETSST